jgi:cyclic pyranopterin phosphate synthase
VGAGGEARMVDVGAKPATERFAAAEGAIRMSAEALALVAGNAAAKGDVLAVARVAGLMAAKRTADLIPLCHPVALSHAAVDLAVDPALPGVRVRATARTVAGTGVEMEALVAASVALLTVYDMVKAADRAMVLEGVRVVEKRGGRSGDWRADAR